MSVCRRNVKIFPGSGPTGSGERGNMVYVLIGALAASGGLAMITERNLFTVNEQALEGASELARESNISAINMLKVLMAIPVANPSARNSQHVPSLFPDVYVNGTAPNNVKIAMITNGATAAAQGLWRVNEVAGTPQIQIASPDLRFTDGTVAASRVFSASHYSAAPAGPGSVQTKITSVRPVYEGAVISLISHYDVSVESSVAISARNPQKGSRTVTTKARIGVDRPPVPECDITVSQPGPVVPGTNIESNFKSYGVVFSARNQVPGANGALAWKSVAVPSGAKSIRSTLNGGTDMVSRWVGPARSTEGFNTREGKMRLSGEVTGPAQDKSSCNAAVRVYIPPTCSITATPAILSDDGSTTLAVRASGAVDRMVLFGVHYTGTGARSQNVRWTPAASGEMTATATVYGPGGMTGQCSTAIVKDRCRFASGTRVNTAIGSTVPAFDNNYHQTWHDWVTAGGSCRNEANVVFDDRTCVPCSPSDLCGRYNPNGIATADGATFWRIVNYHSGENCQFQLGFIRSAGRGCFAAATELTMADGSRRSISQIKQSDVLWNPVTGQPRRIKKIIRGPERKPMVELVVGGHRLVVTEDHPFRTGFGYFPAIQIRVGDVVISSGSEQVPVTSVRRIAPLLGPLEVDRLKIGDADLPIVWNVELENISGNPEDYMVEANGVSAGDLWLQERLKNPKQDRGS